MSVASLPFEGHVEPQFAPVLDAFVANFEQGREVGAAVAVYHRGALVVDLAAGMRDRTSAMPYTRATLQAVFSVAKGITALAANMLVDQGRLDLNAPVASDWPEVAQAGKSTIPVEWLLTHRSGVLGLDRKISLEQLLDWEFVVKLLAAQAPDWEPGSQHGYHSLTFGFLVGEVIRRITGQKKPAVRKARNHLRVSSHNQRTQARVGKLARGTQFDIAICSITGGQQCRIGNTKLEMLYVHESDPISHMALAHC
jgi:CubicO group peptidase (beta-lactamase class C family)